jgi:pSer/pThr/pTyr-binding forkhead associated (FHA) protein
LRDFASTYGTYLNGVKLPELGVEILHHDDEISLGPIERGGVLLRFELVLTDEDMPDEVRDTIPAEEDEEEEGYPEEYY